MLAYSDNNPQEFEFLQDGILVRWNVVEGKDSQDKHTTYDYKEVKIELTDILDQIISKLINEGYTDNINDFANKILTFKGN